MLLARERHDAAAAHEAPDYDVYAALRTLRMPRDARCPQVPHGAGPMPCRRRRHAEVASISRRCCARPLSTPGQRRRRRERRREDYAR